MKWLEIIQIALPSKSYINFITHSNTFVHLLKVRNIEIF